MSKKMKAWVVLVFYHEWGEMERKFKEDAAEGKQAKAPYL